MWILLALLAAAASAGTSLLLKRAVGLAGVVVSTVAFRTVGGVLLAIATLAGGPLPAPTPMFWRALAIVIPNEIGGMLCLSMALSKGDVSVVQPIMGIIPLLTMAGGALILHEQPSGLAVAGILLVVMGLYFVGLPKGGSALEPIRAFSKSRASWYALLATLFWTVTSLTHKVGIAEIGPMPWATALTLGSAVALAVVLPLIARTRGGVGLPREGVPWTGIIALCGVCFAIQQFGLHNALRRSQAGYVMAVVSTSILLATAVGVLVLREQGGAHRISGALLVSSGVALIAVFG
ncbi:MAG TPA: DMT family transporter [Gemmatimonadaceae bacterium]|nr:DMT family transporter [Gemmatimonadaceae bacterium]